MRITDIQSKTMYTRYPHKYSAPQPCFVIEADQYYVIANKPIFETQHHTVEVSPGIHDVVERQVRVGSKQVFVKTESGKSDRWSSRTPGLRCLVLSSRQNKETGEYEPAWIQALVTTREIYDADPWEVLQAREERRLAEEKREEQAEAERKAAYAERQAVIDRLTELGVVTRSLYNPTYGSHRSLDLTLDEITALLDRAEGVSSVARDLAVAGA